VGNDTADSAGTDDEDFVHDENVEKSAWNLRRAGGVRGMIGAMRVGSIRDAELRFHLFDFVGEFAPARVGVFERVGDF
jgi:hypothetical protein